MKGSRSGVLAAMLNTMPGSDAPAPQNLKPSRGRGNQGDWVAPRGRELKVLPEHAAHNEQIDAKRAARKHRRESRNKGDIK